MNWLDICFLLILVISVATGFRRGFVRIGIGFAATIVGFLLGAWWYGLVGDWFMPYVNSRSIANLIGFTLVFAGVMICGAVISFALAKALRVVGLGAVDRIGGAAFGLVRGTLILIVIVMAMLAFPRRPPEAIVQSRIAPQLVEPARMISRLAPYEVREGMFRAYHEVRQMWREVVRRPAARPATKEI